MVKTKHIEHRTHNSLSYNIKLFKNKHSVFSYILTFKRTQSSHSSKQNTYNGERPSFNLMKAAKSKLSLGFMDILNQVRSLCLTFEIVNAYVSLVGVLQFFTKINILVDPPLVTSGQVGNLLISLMALRHKKSNTFTSKAARTLTFPKFSQYGLRSIAMECLHFGTIFGP